MNKGGHLNAAYARLSPLQKLKYRYEAVFHGKLAELEQRLPFVIPPWWTRVPITIAKSAGEATAFHNDIRRNGRQRSFYTDGSGINDLIGASAVETVVLHDLELPGIPQTMAVGQKQACLGPSTSFTVYFGELYGILIAIKITPVDYVRDSQLSD